MTQHFCMNCGIDAGYDIKNCPNCGQVFDHEYWRRVIKEARSDTWRAVLLMGVLPLVVAAVAVGVTLLVV